MPENIDIKTELEAKDIQRPEIDPKHQFNEEGLKYENKNHLMLWLAVFLVAALGIGYILVGEQAQELFNSLRSESNNFPVSFATSSSTSSQTRLISGQDFEESNDEEIFSTMQADLDKAAGFAKPEEVYPEFDARVELGVKPKATQTEKK